MDDQRIKRVLVVGGGTAGWMSATYLRKLLGDDVQVTLIESPTVGRMGVGEATVPSIKEEVFDLLGIPESEWMPACKASYKLGIRYENWTRPLRDGGDHYYHLFGELENIEGLPLSHYWLRKKLSGQSCGSLAQDAYVASHLCDAQRSPNGLDGQRVVDYAYHFDAIVVADFLSRWGRRHGVRHILGDVEQVKLDERGWIAGVVTSSGETVTADLYLDCTGFRGLLINQALKEPFISYGDNLLCDRAVAMNVPDAPEVEIAPYTRASALDNGWVWTIPLVGRRGCGYVYSSAFTSPEAAEREFFDFLGVEPSDEWPARHLKMRVGRTERAWVNNCVSIGLSNSFIEPLESTGIYFGYAALFQLGKYFPSRQMEPALQDKFNERIAFMVDDVRDFIVMHYCTTPREDSAFWRACKHDLPIPDSLGETLDLWDAGVPVKSSYSGDLLYQQFEASYDRFWTNSNYAAVLTGMGRLPRQPAPLLAFRARAIERAEQRFREIAAEGARRARSLPSQRDYLLSQGQGAAPDLSATVPREAAL